MHFTIQLLIESDGLEPTTTDIVTLQREALDAESIGLHICEAKNLLEQLQSSRVASQINEFVEQSR